MSSLALIAVSVTGFGIFATGMWLHWWRFAAVGLTITWAGLCVVLVERILYLWSGK